MDPFEELFCRRCRSRVGCFEVGESLVYCPGMIYKSLEKVHLIRHRLKMTYSRQKSYANNRRGDIEFEVGDKVYLKISPMKGVMRFGKKGNLSPRYVGPMRYLNGSGRWLMSWIYQVH